jgi:hypothetical protein
MNSIINSVTTLTTSQIEKLSDGSSISCPKCKHYNALLRFMSHETDGIECDLMCRDCREKFVIVPDDQPAAELEIETFDVPAKAEGIGEFQIGRRVERIKGENYQLGKQGEIVEIDQAAGRIRIMWDGDKRTWIKVSTGAVRLLDRVPAAENLASSIAEPGSVEYAINALNKQWFSVADLQTWFSREACSIMDPAKAAEARALVNAQYHTERTLQNDFPGTDFGQGAGRMADALQVALTNLHEVAGSPDPAPAAPAAPAKAATQMEIRKALQQMRTSRTGETMFRGFLLRWVQQSAGVGFYRQLVRILDPVANKSLALVRCSDLAMIQAELARIENEILLESQKAPASEVQESSAEQANGQALLPKFAEGDVVSFRWGSARIQGVIDELRPAPAVGEEWQSALVSCDHPDFWSHGQGGAKEMWVRDLTFLERPALKPTAEELGMQLLAEAHDMARGTELGLQLHREFPGKVIYLTSQEIASLSNDQMDRLLWDKFCQVYFSSCTINAVKVERRHREWLAEQQQQEQAAEDLKAQLPDFAGKCPMCGSRCTYYRDTEAELVECNGCTLEVGREDYEAWQLRQATGQRSVANGKA